MRLAALALSALPLFALAEPISLKGLAPGMTKAQMSATHDSLGGGCTKPERDPSIDEVCGYVTKYHKGIPALHTLAGVDVDQWTILLKDGVVQTVIITLPASDFERVEASMVERWGKPATRTTGTVKNRMGATFDQVQANWISDGTVLRGMKRGGKVDQASFYLTTERGMAERDKARKDAAKAGAKDM